MSAGDSPIFRDFCLSLLKYCKGTWEMDVIFETGISFAYFGDTKLGWYYEGCFTCLECAKTKENCWGSGEGYSNHDIFRDLIPFTEIVIQIICVDNC